jgi:hypothetical protein
MVAKIYIDNQKYDGISESFDFKLAIFDDICRRAGLQPDGYMTEFLDMLKGIAQDNDYSRNLSIKMYPEPCTHTRNFFGRSELL